MDPGIVALIGMICSLVGQWLKNRSQDQALAVTREQLAKVEVAVQQCEQERTLLAKLMGERLSGQDGDPISPF